MNRIVDKMYRSTLIYTDESYIFQHEIVLKKRLLKENYQI